MSDTNQTTVTPIPEPVAGKTKTSRNAFAFKLKNMTYMVNGLTAGADLLKAKGITPESIAVIKQLYQDILDVTDQRNAAKSQSVTLTKSLDDKMAEMQDRYSEVKKRLKLELPREDWPKYGFYDQR